MNRTPQLGTGGLSSKLERLWSAIQRLTPVSNEYMRAAQATTGGVTLMPTDALFSKLKSAGGTQEFTLTETAPRTLTADATTITKPVKLKSLSDTRDDSGQTENWEPSHTTVATRPATPSFNYANEHYRWRIVHKTVLLADNVTEIDYVKILERLEPRYEIGDVIYAAKFGGDWIDLNVDGRRWVPVIEWVPTQYLIGPQPGVYANEHSQPWPLMQSQDESQQYGGTAQWLSRIDFTALDIY